MGVVNKRGKATGETEKQEAKFEAGKHRDRIFGNHIFNYMTQLKKEDKEKYTRQFKCWDKCMTDNKVKSLEELYKKVHPPSSRTLIERRRLPRRPPSLRLTPSLMTAWPRSTRTPR